MNSYERVITALELKEPDHVPIIECTIDPKVIKGACPQARDAADFAEMVGLDAVSCRTDYGKVVDNADGTYVDEWGVIYKNQWTQVISHPVRGPIESMADLRTYNPPDPDAPERLADLHDLVRRFKGRKAIIYADRACFMWSVFLNGMDNLLTSFLTEPEFAHALLDMVLDVSIQVARNALRAGADAIIETDDYAGNRGPIMSPEVFKEFILPRLLKYVKAVHEEGGYLIKHTDGYIWPLLDTMVEAEIDGINPMEPIAGMDIGEVKQAYGDRVCLVGNIDCGELLTNGSTQEVEAAVMDCIRKASPGGGHIMCSSNSLHASVKPENYLTMVKATRRFGKYPLCL